jgi:hypothetical protein
MLSQWLWFMVCYFEPVIVNHSLLCWISGCESWWVMMSQWLWIMVCIVEQGIVNHNELYSGCESWCVILVNHGELYWPSGCESWWVMLCQGCESWCVMLSQRLWIMLCYTDSSGCESWCVMLSQWLCIMVWYAVPVVARNSPPLFTTTGLSIAHSDSKPLYWG